MEITYSDPGIWRQSARRAADFLISRLSSTGGIQEHMGTSRLSPAQALARLDNLFDVWHTVSAILVFNALGLSVKEATEFVTRQVLEGGGLSHCSMRPGLCIETTAAASLAIPELRPSLQTVLRRHALPAGRWASFILDRPNGYDLYMCGPSATGWALTALGPDDPLVEPGRRYLLAACGSSGIWPAHSYACGTPFYPAHVGVAWLSDRGRVLKYVLGTVGSTGAWGFGDPPASEPSVLPTALALLVVMICDPELAIAHDCAVRAAQWLVRSQFGDGSFPSEPIPLAVWYLGPVYVTAVAAMALAQLARIHSSPAQGHLSSI